jgi:hypothetical protein
MFILQSKNSFENLNNLKDSLAKYIPNYEKYEIHARFLFLEVDSNSFNTCYNRDFSIKSNHPKHEKRSSKEYFPLKGFIHMDLI